MVLCSNCKKNVAVIFVTKMENGQKTSQGLCIKCAKEMGLPINNMLGNVFEKFGISPDQVGNVEDEINEMLSGSLPSEMDDKEEGGAPAVDFPQLFRDAGLVPQSEDSKKGNVPDLSSLTGKEKKTVKPNTMDKTKKYKFLPTYCRNLTQLARDGKLDKIVGREKEMARMTQILCRRQKNNPCLIGEPGVGKTAIAEALATAVAAKKVPFKLMNKEIYQLDLTALVAGTQFRGQFESRVLGLLNEVKEAGNIILVIDEIHNLVGTGEAEGSVNAANILKPALSRGEVQIIGATTLNEYRKYIEKDAALERRFQPITVEEPSVADAAEMLRGIKHYYEEYHGIRIPDDVLQKTVTLSERYITDRYLPDKAIDLLDEAAASLSLSSAVLNESAEIRDRLLSLKDERERLENAEVSPDDTSASDGHFEKLAQIKSEEMRLSQRLKDIEPDCASVTLTTENLAQVIEIWTGIPASNITENEFERLDKLEARLKDRIIGQDKAVEAVVKAVKRNRAGIAYKRKPVSFIFAGPTGVGKTELVKTLADDLFQSPETLIRLDMSEFMEKHAVSRIIGAPPGYVGYDEAGQLTEKIRRRPYSIVLFDEIEKAHPDVLNILLQILDDGQVTDAHGKKVNFENTIIVMTTNAGTGTGASLAGFTGDNTTAVETKTENALLTFLRPEFVNRVDEVITFNALTEQDFSQIACIMLNQLKSSMKERDVDLSYTQEVADWVAKNSYSRKYGARNMRRYIQKHVEDPLASVIVADYEKNISDVKLTVLNDEIRILSV